VEQFERIRRDRREEGVSIRGLARRHRVHRRTVRQALSAALPPPRKRPERAAPILGPHLATIRRWLADDRSAPRKQRHTARRVWQRLCDEEGASVAESTVRGVVAALRRELESGTSPVTVPQLHPPGEEAEADFGEAGFLVAGVLTRLSIFHLRLSHSARAVHAASPSEGQEAFLEGHAQAFERLGGVPARIRYDNLKPAVVRILRGRDRVETERFVAFRSHYGFDSFFCEPGEAGSHEKGGVENDVGRFRRRHLVPLPQVASLAEANALLERADAADDARHVEGRRLTVGAMAAVERPHLRPLPDEPFDATVHLAPKVDRKARICVRGSHYSVPVRLASRRVDVRLGATTIRVLDGGRLVAVHERSLAKGEQVLVLDHYLELLSRKPGAFAGSVPLAQARAAGAFTPAHERFWKRARKRFGDAAGTRALIEVLLVHRSLPFVAVHAALDAVERIGSADPALVAIEARRIADGRGPTSVVLGRTDSLRRFDRPVPLLAGYDALLAGAGS
jgi:transposase